METPLLAPKHSLLGIFSFVICCLCMFLLFIAFMVAGYLETTTPGGMDEEAWSTIIIGIAIIFLGSGLVFSFGLGIAGLFQKNTKKLFSIMGVCLSSLSLAFTFILMVIGSMA